MTENNTNYNQKQPEVSTFCNLTEQWKKGELPEGDYYIERRNGYLLYDNIDSHGVWRNSIDEDIVEVLAPVPSYEEWKSLNEILDSSLQTNKALAHRLNLCKELLKECKQMFVAEKSFLVQCSRLDDIENIITKIDNAIGEKK